MGDLVKMPANVAQDAVVRRLLDAEKALKQATDVQQVKLVMNVAAAQEVFAARQKLGEDVIGYAHALKIHALGRLGELLRDLPKAEGARAGGKKESPRGSYVLPRDSAATLAELGIDKKTSSVAQQLAALPSATREAIAQREQTLQEALREKTAKAVIERISLPDAKYRVLYADPPWAYNDKADAGSVQSGGAERHYPSMSIRELCEMPVSGISESDAVLFLWVTSPLLFESSAVIEAWGFTYRASFVWDKVKHNMGHYNSVRHEFLLICTRGRATPDHVELFDSVQTVERTEHSEKPAIFRTIVDTLYPNGKRLELFARRDDIPGWEAYGNQLPSGNIRAQA